MTDREKLTEAARLIREVRVEDDGRQAALEIAGTCVENVRDEEGEDASS